MLLFVHFPLSDTVITLHCTTLNIVFSHVQKLCKSKATGLDKISARLFCICPNLISESLCVIFNRSNTGIFPDERSNMVNAETQIIIAPFQ